MFDIEKQLERLPDQPGVYLMKDTTGQVIYVGKSKRLSKRVRSYFRSFNSKRRKVQRMIKNIDSFEYFITDTEEEALILEANLIKKYNPRFNILLRDDKQYPYIKVTLNEEYPRVIMTREFIKDGGKYFGPYTSSGAVKSTIEAIQNVFNIRKCNKDLSKAYNRPCLNFQINECLGPCCHKKNHEEYMQQIDIILEILNGDQKLLVEKLEAKMKAKAKELNFETAAKLRDQLRTVKQLTKKQKINSGRGDIHDIISFYKGEEKLCVMIFFIRGGNIVGRDKFVFEEDTIDNALSSFIIQFYSGSKFIPKSILIKEEINDRIIIENFLTKLKGKKVSIKVPKKGYKKKQIDLVSKNAQEYLTKFEDNIKKEKEKVNNTLDELKNLLKLKEQPIRIEAYDISNIYGVYSVGSMVVFEKGKKKKNAYRRFKIKTVEGADDYSSMQEILFRRFNRGLKELKAIQKSEEVIDQMKFNIFPDLLLIDGGKGHVNAVKKVLLALKLDIPVCGMVKDEYHKTRGLFFEGEEIRLNKKSLSYKFIYKIQEEVHRFAIHYHKSLRRKNMTRSLLDEISGIGPSRRRDLMKYFKSIQNIKRASIEELKKVPGISEVSANKIYNFFNN